MRKTIFILTVFFIFMASSCKGFYQEAFDISSEERITLQLPAWPPSDSLQSSYPPLSRWIISVESEDFSTTISCPVNDTGKIMPPFSKSEISFSGNSLSLKVKKNKPMSITAQPVTKGISTSDSSSQKEIIFFAPAGFLYPYHAPSPHSSPSSNPTPHSSPSTLTWSQGFLASLMESIFQNKDYTKSQLNTFISCFNWKKATSIIENKISDSTKLDTTYNPWLLDKTRLIEKICSKKASTIYFNLSSTEEVPLSLLVQDKNSSSPQDSLSDSSPDSAPTPTVPLPPTHASPSISTPDSPENSLPASQIPATEPTILSSFIPENSVLATTKKIILKKQQPLLIYTSKNTGIIVTYSSINKISLEYIFLPIYIEGI